MNFLKYFTILFLNLIILCTPLYADHQKISLQLKWKHAFQFAGFYVALEKGFYAREKLDVKIIEGTPDRDSVSYVLNHSNSYGISNSRALIEFDKGKPICAIAAIFSKISNSFYGLWHTNFNLNNSHKFFHPKSPLYTSFIL